MSSGGADMAEENLKAIIYIIDLLISTKHINVNAQIGSLDLLLKRRLHHFTEAVTADSNLSKVLFENSPHLLQPCGKRASMAKTPSELRGSSQQCNAPPAPPTCLGALQQKTVQSLLQFVVALGINSNLLPGVGLALE
ncbi:hypothetical protein MRX96_031120 [Rhipicephalus microplus]